MHYIRIQRSYQPVLLISKWFALHFESLQEFNINIVCCKWCHPSLSVWHQHVQYEICKYYCCSRTWQWHVCDTVTPLLCHKKSHLHT